MMDGVLLDTEGFSYANLFSVSSSLISLVVHRVLTSTYGVFGDEVAMLFLV